MDQHAGGERAGGEACPAKDQAYADEQQKRAERPAGLVGVHEGEGRLVRMEPTIMAQWTIGDDRWRRAARRAGGCCAQWTSPMRCRERGAENRGRRSPQEGCGGNAESEEEPCRSGGAEDFVDGRVFGAGMSQPLTRASRKQTNAAKKSWRRRRRAVAAFHCRPAKNPLYQRGERRAGRPGM